METGETKTLFLIVNVIRFLARPHFRKLLLSKGFVFPAILQNRTYFCNYAIYYF